MAWRVLRHGLLGPAGAGDGGRGAFWARIPLVALTAAVALLVAGLAMAAYNDRAYRAQKVQELEVQARILAATVTAALVFEDRSAAQEYVSALGANSELQAAAVYDGAGALLAGYARPGAPPLPERRDPAAPVGGPEFEDRFVVVSERVAQGSATIGSVRLRAVTEPLGRRIERYSGIALLVTMASLLVVVLGAAHAALSRANEELRDQASALERANAQLKAEIAEREKAEDALLQSQKMEAIGQLSGGVAHDFNNLLQALAGCLRMIERKAPMPEIRPLLDAGKQAVERGAKLTQQLMAFARRQALRPEPVDVAQRLLGMSELLARALRADIELRLDLERGLWPVEVDPTQFELAVLNLAVNARDAMPEGGRLLVEGRNLSLAPGEDPLGTVGEHVRISVSDTGTGIPPDVLERVFEPFFTTKGVGKGTGLGLSQVYGFARQSGGTAGIASEPGRGTTVTLVLPRCLGTPAAPVPEPSRRSGSGAGRKVLLVEDDPVVGPVMAAAIEDIGYAVTRATSADEALALFARGEPVDVLFSDIVMPGAMSGVDLAREARRLRPGLPVLLTSGYSEGTAAAKEFRILAKPYRTETLAQVLAEVTAEMGAEMGAEAEAGRARAGDEARPAPA